MNAVETGGEVKGLLESGDVLVNGAIVVQRGHQLGVGDTISVGKKTWTLA